MSEKRTELSDLGEFGLIEQISRNTKISQASTLKGIGDDAAVLKTNSDQHTVISTDLLLEGTHFDLAYVPLQHLGYKAVAVNISDICAMNAIAEQITVSLGLSNRFSLEAVDALYEGIQLACQSYNVDLVGGDTTSSRSGLVISITAIGRVSPEKMAYRNTAQNNDILCVTGDLGGAYTGLQILEREKQVFLANPEMQPQLERNSYVVGRQLKPEARADIIHELADLEIVPTSMIDISDGLASEALHLARQSGLGVMLYEDKIPIDKETYDIIINDFKFSPTIAALNGGEDYELLFTIRQSDYEKIKNHRDISTIGHMTAKKQGYKLTSRSGAILDLKAQGWTHFAS